MISLVRIWAIAANGFREIVRDRLLYAIGLFAVLLAFALRLLPEIAAATEDKMIVDFGLGVIGLLSMIVAILIGTGLINKEIERRTVLVLLPKPLNCTELIVGKYLGLVGVLAILVGTTGTIDLLSLSLLQIPYSVVPLVVSLLYLLLELSLLVAAALAFGVFTSSLLAALMTFGAYAMGHLSQDLVKLGQIGQNKTIETLVQNLYLVLPDLSRLNLRNEAVYGVLPNSQALLNSAIYGLGYTAVLLAIAIAILSRRQF
ncbi:MAG: ABC transporter permease [Cyanobacteriota bacterium]|nr:ABC transporter permease [Cyanobacteriota bacterium]